MPIKWLVYSVLLGLVPSIARLLAWWISAPTADISPIHAGDLASFGLLLMVTNFNGLEGATVDANWKTITTGLCLVYVVLFAIVFIGTVLADRGQGAFDETKILIASATLSGASCLHSFTIWRRLSIKAGGP